MNTIISSEYNRLPQVLETLDFPDEVFIVDSTIRSLQAGISGSKHTLQDLIEIGKALDDLGVREQLINLQYLETSPGYPKDALAVCEGLAQENLKCKLVANLRARNPLWERWVDDAIKAGVDEICFESPPDVEHLRRTADLVQSQGKTVSLAFAETYSYQEVVHLCRRGAKWGYQSCSLHDSFLRFGITPEAIKFLVKSLKADVPQCPPLYIHLSNFYGHATMTAVAALAAGASAADVCMNGTGHQSGHIPLSQIVMVLEGLYGVNTGIELSKLREVSPLVREKSGIPMPLAEPISGDFAFMHDGAFWAAEADRPYEERVHALLPFPPYLVGSEERVIWSDKTITWDSIKVRLESMGLTYQEKDIERIMDRLGHVLREKAEYPIWLLNSEFEDLCRTVLCEKDEEKA